MNRAIFVPAFAAALLVTYACGDSLDPNVVPTGLRPPVPAAEMQLTAVVDLSGRNPLNAAGCRTMADGTTTFNECVFFGPIVGDILDGDYFAVLDGTVDAAGNGATRGRLEVAACVGTRCGDFEGRFTGVFVAGVRSDVIEMTGQNGEVRGLSIEGTFVEQGAAPGTNVFDLTGTIRRSID